MASQRPPVVTAVDGARGRLATVDLAAAEARRRGADLLVVHVWPGRYAAPFHAARGRPPTEEDGRRLLALAAYRAELAEPRLTVRTLLCSGEPAGRLTELSARAQLLVVGHRDDVLARHGWGSTAAYLARQAACPLLVDRGEARARGPVVLAASARDPDGPTAGCAFAEAHRLAAPLTAVHVWAPPPPGRDPEAPLRPTRRAAARDEAERALAEALAGWSVRYPDVVVHRSVVQDLDLAYTVARASHRGRLLVAGAGRTRRMAELLYGSPGPALVGAAACPVLLVPPGRPAVVG